MEQKKNTYYKNKILIFAGTNPKSFSGGTSSFINNLDKYMCYSFDITYKYVPSIFLKQYLIPRRLINFFMTLFFLLKNSKKFDLIFSHVPESSYVASFFRKPLVHIFHGNNNPLEHSKFWYSKYLRNLFYIFEQRIRRKATKLYTVGEKRNVAEKIYNPIDSLQPSSFNVRKNIIFIGRLEKVKKIERVIDIYSQLPLSLKDSHKLIIIGDGSERSFLQKYAGKEKENILFKGFIPNPEAIALLKMSKILILMSDKEGFPMVIAEALSLGIPVVSTSVGDISSIIKNGYNGFCLDPKTDNTQFVQCIIKILDEYKSYAGNSLLSSSIFNAEGIAKKLTEDFISIIEKK